MRQLILDLLPAAAPSVDNFIAGSNAEALTALAAWLDDSPASSGECSLLFWGEAGSGKTHLLRASTPRYIDAKVDADLAELADLPPDTTPATYAVDHVEALSECGQIALFNVFNRLRACGGKLLTAAGEPPRRLVLREDLRTRLGSGLIYQLHPLTDAEKISALTAQADARGLRLPPEALDYLLLRAPRDMRSLCALLTALDRYSLEHKRPITMPLLREVLHTPSH